MQLIDFLQQRTSTPARMLTEPAPDNAQIEQIVQAGLAAPDHAAMRPWKFIVIRGDARTELGEVFAEATRQRDPDMAADKLEAQKSKPLRSPLIIAIVAKITPNHPKTPEIEQILSAGAAAQQMQLAANALGFGSVWLTGPNARDNNVKSALGIDSNDELVGFLYLGTVGASRPAPARASVSDHLQYWRNC